MFGFIIGTASLIGLIAVLRRGRRRYWGYGHHGHSCGRHGWHGHHEGRGPRGGFRGGPLYWLFDHLETTPGQEKAIREAVEQLRDTARGTKKELRASGEDVARALRSETFDEALVGDMFARQDDSVRELQKAFAGALAKIHDALDEKQRGRLAELLESGRGFAGFGGPYRSWV
jgi:Spy/CpxP family protein refolding chaperone